MKKFVVLIAVILLFTQTVAMASFADVNGETTQGKAILKMAEKGVVNGVGGGYFKPNDSLTRSQFVKIVNKVFGYTHIGENKFTDVVKGKWYYDDICIASEMGYIDGIGGGLFAPEAVVTREQACVIVDNILKMELIPYYEEPKDKISSWAKDSVIKALSNRLLSLEEGGFLRATEPMTRGEVCEMLEKCLVEDVGEIERIDLSTIAREELEMRMNRVIKAMNERVIPELTDEKSRQVGYMVVLNMQKYLEDSSHDYEKASKDTFEVYKTIPKELRTVFKDTVQRYNQIDDLMLLYEFFYIVD